MADQTHHSGGLVGDVKSALKGVKGAGDAIRGTFNESVDAAFNEPQGEIKNRAIADKGKAEMKAADARFAGGQHAAGPSADGSTTLYTEGAERPVVNEHGANTAVAGTHTGLDRSTVTQGGPGGVSAPTGSRY